MEGVTVIKGIKADKRRVGLLGFGLSVFGFETCLILFSDFAEKEVPLDEAP
jgi:hypothetical protein